MNTNQSTEEIGNPDDWSYEVRAKEEPMFPADFMSCPEMSKGGLGHGARY